MGKSIRRKMYMYYRNCLLALLENYPISDVFRTLSEFIMDRLNFYRTRFSVPEEQKRREAERLLETGDYVKIILFIMINFAGIIRKRRKTGRLRKRPREYLLEINRNLIT